MPICRTCRGEYDQQEALCPKCEVPVGQRVERCDRCETDTSERRLCPRCKSDVSAWEKQDVNFVDFVIWEGGIMGFLPGTAALFMWLFFWVPRVESTYYLPMLTLVTFLICFLVVFVLYVKRLFWWERWLASQVYRPRRYRSSRRYCSPGSGVFFFQRCGFFSSRDGVNLEALPRKAIFGAVYLPSYILLTICATLIVIHMYISRLERLCATTDFYGHAAPAAGRREERDRDGEPRVYEYA